MHVYLLSIHNRLTFCHKDLTGNQNIKQGSCWAYGTAVSGLVIHLNKIYLNHSQIWGASEYEPNPNYNPNPT